jgi:hypothetical protein
MSSKKTKVIEHLFFTRYNPKHGLTGDPVVTFDEIRQAIQNTGVGLKTDNLANFWKDLTRTDPEKLWPPSVRNAGFSGEDAIGDKSGASFRFVKNGTQNTGRRPVLPSPKALKAEIKLESVSMPMAMKSLGRTDENWLAQVAVRLRVIETHFAINSKTVTKEIAFLQTGVKLGPGEVDAAYCLVSEDDGRWLLAVEAKGRRENVNVSQIQRAAKALLAFARSKSWDVRGVIPMALKTIGDSLLHVAEFDPDNGKGSAGRVTSQSVIRLQPPVTGVH